MRKELSILIPTYNTDCTQLVNDLHAQAIMQDSLAFEIIVADDGSTEDICVECLAKLESISHVRLLSHRENVGRAAIRNVLAREAQYQHLLFIDSDMKISDNDFLSRYLKAEGEVIYGGYSIASMPLLQNRNLRYMYEVEAAPRQIPEKRALHPHRDFHTSNFLVERDIILRHPFDERFRFYGYEDVFWGKQMKSNNIPIRHIDNPVVFHEFEENAHFMEKTEEGLRTLHQFSEELKGYSSLLDFTKRHTFLCTVVRQWHRLLGEAERRNLIGSNPSTLLFKLYKLGYFISLDKTAR